MHGFITLSDVTSYDKHQGPVQFYNMSGGGGCGVGVGLLLSYFKILEMWLGWNYGITKEMNFISSLQIFRMYMSTNTASMNR